ncbi:hypothetical protein NMG60_11012575 [Bertholletia excelsa]
MADEVENFLVDKLKKVLPDVRSLVKRNWDFKCWSADNKITKLLELLNDPNSIRGRKELLYNLDNILTEYQVRPKNRDLSANLDKILSGLSSESSHLSIDESKVHGFEHKVKTLLRQLVRQNADDSKFRAIGIVGMRGVGKTTLSQLIFCNEELKNHFVPRIWVCASEQPKEDKDNRKEIVKRMLTCLGVEGDVIESIGPGLKGLLFALRLQLMGKRYLIILDDLWNVEEKMKAFCLDIAEDSKCREKLAYGLPKGHGGAVIVTSRTEEVVEGMVGEGNSKCLEPLKDDKKSIWTIFAEAATKNGKTLTPELISLEERIVDKCAGLPLAAKMMGDMANEQIATAYEPTPPNPAVQNSSQNAEGGETPPKPTNQGSNEEDAEEEEEHEHVED